MLKKYGDQRFKEPHLDQPQGRTAERPRLCLAEHRDPKRRIHHLRRNIAVEEALAPSGVQVRNGLLAAISPADLPAVFSFCTRSRATTSMSRNLVISALLPSGPCPGTILLLSAKGRTLSAATIIPSIFPPVRASMTGQ